MSCKTKDILIQKKNIGANLLDVININYQLALPPGRVLILLFLAGTLIMSSCRNTDYEEHWYVFNPEENGSETVIDMSDWLDKPAGNHGFVEVKGKDLIFEDGEKVKFWGVNICSQRPYSDKNTIDKWVPFLAKYGINSVRFHKYTYHGMKGPGSTEIDPGLQENMDYFQHRLKEAGIYFGWSPIYGHKVRPGDRNRLLAYDEIAAADMGSHLSFSTIGLVNFAEDVQDLHIELLTNLLNHKNPYTGLRYAEDPALTFVEIQNEDNIWFATTDRILELCPTYKQLLTDKFTVWLQEKYKDQKGLLNAWGEDAFRWGNEVRKTDWNLDKGNICPVASHGIYQYEYTKAAENGDNMPLFLRDMAYFLFLEQNRFYDKALKAIRKTGYQGPVIGSCWQAGAGITHFYNLYADYRMGIIDRHNYFGGGTGHRLVPGTFKNTPMVSRPGSGLLSTGKQAVEDRPFQFSEWMSLPPNEWIAEGPPLIAVYGMGLQGWDGSQAFANDFPELTETIHTPGVYNINAPTQISLYPSLFAMITRDEIKEGDIVAKRNVHLPSLKDGVIGFNEMVKQDWDQKVFSGGAPDEYLAAGQVVIDFTDEFTETEIEDFSDYVDTINRVVKSNTGQLEWDYSGKGYFTANTEFTKLLTGFSEGKKIDFGDVSLKTDNPFAVVILTSLDPDKDLKATSSALLTVVARAKNSGMIFNESKTEILEVGEAPILMEAVNLELRMKDRMIREIFPLNHAGQRTTKRLVVNNGNYYLDGKENETLYYEIVFKD